MNMIVKNSNGLSGKQEKAFIMKKKEIGEYNIEIFQALYRSYFTSFLVDVKEALAAGMNDHLAKPIRIEMLHNVMSKYL